MEIKIRQKINTYNSKFSCSKPNKVGYLCAAQKNDSFVKAQVSFGNFYSLPFKQFGVKEYKSLSKNEVTLIRSSLDSIILQDRLSVIKLGEYAKKALTKMFPDGFIFISIGRSPALIGKVLELQGLNVKYCPISNLNDGIGIHSGAVIKNLSSEKILKYKNYLDGIGIKAKEIKKSKKNYVFLDHTISGDCLKNFERLLKRPEIGIESKNVHYISLYDLSANKEYRRLLSANIDFQRYKHRDYIQIPKLDYTVMDEVKEYMKVDQTDSTQKMQFALIDYFSRKGLLKD